MEEVSGFGCLLLFKASVKVNAYLQLMSLVLIKTENAKEVCVKNEMLICLMRCI